MCVFAFMHVYGGSSHLGAFVLCVAESCVCAHGQILSFKAGPFVDEKTSEGVIDGAVSDSLR